jgi:hypothetical protein
MNLRLPGDFFSPFLLPHSYSLLLLFASGVCLDAQTYSTHTFLSYTTGTSNAAILKVGSKSENKKKDGFTPPLSRFLGLFKIANRESQKQHGKNNCHMLVAC